MAVRCAVFRSLVQIEAVRPYSTAFTVSSIFASSCHLNSLARGEECFPFSLECFPASRLEHLFSLCCNPAGSNSVLTSLFYPLILIQAAGLRRPIRSTWLVGLPFGGALGILYSVTTISGPPLAILFNNQGLVKNEFRAGLALVRVVESSVTAIVYFKLGLFIAESANILLVLIPSVVVGIPLGAYVIRRLDAETFRRICMSFDAWVVGFGLSRVLIELNLMESPWAYSVMAVTILIDLYLLYFFTTWIHFKNKGDLEIMVEGDKRMFNQYAAILVNPDKHPNVKKDLGRQFIDWLVSPEGQKAIADYKINGEQLFYPNATDPNA